jgi:AmmeMemoRadiSam system protein B/AmmeMemoRadiSam system protein A
MKGKRILFALGLICLAAFMTAAQRIRKPVWAGQFYEEDANALSSQIDVFLAAAKPESVPPGDIRALIVPHAGYIYSGKVAAAAYGLVQRKGIETVVILGPSHRVGFEGCSIYPDGGFETPLGVSEIDTATARAIVHASGYRFIPEAHAEEHSIEVQVPFIQKALPKAKIVPIVMGVPSEPTVRNLAGALDKILKNKKALVVASTDMSHFLNKTDANALDQNTIELVQNLKTGTLLKKIERNENILCGGGPVLTALLYAQKAGDAKVTVLSYADSTQGGGPDDRVVGYFAAAVTGGVAEQSGFSLSADEKKELLSLARRAVDLFVREKKILDYQTMDPNFLSEKGTFVTLKKKGELRGCIGFIDPLYPLYQAVIQCAVYAASEDPRFYPVRAAEVKDLEVEISVLTPLKKIENPENVQVGKHGLVIAKNGNRGLLLPQVAVENRWSRAEFLAQACIKAGLEPNAWKRGAEVFVFEAIVFH